MLVPETGHSARHVPGGISRFGIAILALALGACLQGDGDPLPPGDYTPRAGEHHLSVPPKDRERVRADALRRAKVWLPPATPIAAVDLAVNPPGPDAFGINDIVPCKFELKSSEGRTPKFQCIRAGGEVLKVKYGHNNPETFGEVAATRLVSALGFGADRMYVVGKVRCFGCPAFPYPKVGIFDALRSDASRAVDFEMAVIERRLPGREIEGGWGWPELSSVDAAAGGATRAELDALRLLAVFLDNWDGKPVNQRLLCSEASSQAGECEQPLVHAGPRSDLRAEEHRPRRMDAHAGVGGSGNLPGEHA